ncbi:hypothetical protein [Methylobacterium isbiliense]|jgi:hypothetical protein|uniref:Uncharacterized protein n=1 Tax=Methylobacterium isbiliense TaxID=315478 RepID=A0ABQ4S9Y9_9HYPH|nr:hypothetical protein [Methylobacterium isbiliense]GJD99304.1 hypothetical protein GMJLKIPL_1220 [Methylobacterium isbiliense]
MSHHDPSPNALPTSCLRPGAFRSVLRHRVAAGLLLAAVAAGLTAAAPAVLPGAWQAWRLRQAADDPAALAALQLPAAATEARMGAEIDAALAAKDAELGHSLVALAQAEGVPVAPERRAALAALDEGSTARGVADAARGFATGRGEGLPGLAGAVAADLTGYGDLRDLWTEGGKLLRREPYDEVLLGLSAAGLALTGVTVASFGTAAGASVPAHAGAAALKVAARTGRLSRSLGATLARTTRGLVDGDAAKAALAAAGRLDLAAARQTLRGALRPGAVRTLGELGTAAAGLQARLGTRGALQALSVAENADDLRRAGRLAQGFGGRTRAVLALLGRGALVLGSGLLALAQGLWLGLAWFLAAALFCRRAGTLIGRLIWRRPGSRKAARGVEPRRGDAPRSAGAGLLGARLQHRVGDGQVG